MKKYLQGQNLRLFYGETDPAIVACATNCGIDYNANIESSGTKDDTGLIDDKQATGATGTITSDALVLVGGQQVIKSTMQLVGKKVIAECWATEGEQNREKSDDGFLFRVECIVSGVNISSQNKQNVTYSTKLEFTAEPEWDYQPGE